MTKKLSFTHKKKQRKIPAFENVLNATIFIPFYSGQPRQYIFVPMEIQCYLLVRYEV